MRVLLNENLLKRLKFILLEKGHATSTARKMGWNGRKNEKLLGLLTFNGFDVLITSDKNLVFQQNLDKFDVIVLLLNIKVNRYVYIQPLLDQILATLDGPIAEQFIEIG